MVVRTLAFVVIRRVLSLVGLGPPLDAPLPSSAGGSIGRRLSRPIS